MATAQCSYHISVEHMGYSVPYKYIKQRADVHITQTTVQIFFTGLCITSLLRSRGRLNQYSTAEKHLLPDNQSYTSCSRVTKFDPRSP